MQQFANPHRFLGLVDLVEPWAWAVTVILFAIGLYLALLSHPRITSRARPCGSCSFMSPPLG